MHPWHDVELGKKSPEISTAVVEIPKGSNIKYKLDAKTGLIKVGEFLPTVARYPANYGFFPRTIAADGDALDVFIFGREAVVPLAMMQVRALGGVITLSPKKGKEKKIIAVCPHDSEFKQYNSLKDMPKFYTEVLCQFFEEYKALEGDSKKVIEFFSKKTAQALIVSSAADYAKQFNQGKLKD